MFDIAAQLFIGITVAVLAYVQWRVSLREERQHRKTEAEARRLQVEAEELYQKRQDEAGRIQEARQRDANMAKWGGTVIDLMAELETACNPLASEVVHKRIEFDQLGTRASALVDRGRLFFPNVKGSWQQVDDEGFRVEILDQVLRACYVARFMAARDGTDSPLLMRHHIWQARRRFVSLLQSEMRHSLREVNQASMGVSVPVDPRQWEKPTRPLRLPDQA